MKQNLPTFYKMTAVFDISFREKICGLHGKSQDMLRFLQLTNFYMLLLIHQEENDTTEKNM